jgi:hypothetical protein
MWLSVGGVLESLRLGSFGKAYFVFCILGVHCLVLLELPPLQRVDGGVRPPWTSSALFSWRCAAFFGVPELKGELRPDNPARSALSLLVGVVPLVVVDFVS